MSEHQAVVGQVVWLFQRRTRAPMVVDAGRRGSLPIACAMTVGLVDVKVVQRVTVVPGVRVVVAVRHPAQVVAALRVAARGGHLPNTNEEPLSNARPILIERRDFSSTPTG